MTDKKNIEISPSLKIDPKEMFGVSCEFEVYKFKEKTEHVPEIESSTIAGYILDMSKKIPSYGELFKDNFFTYKILSHSKKQISKVEISKIN